MDLESLRAQINQTDKDLIDILEKRYNLREQIWELKRREGKPLRTPKREREILERQKELARKKGVPEATIELLYRELFSEN